MEEPRYDEDPKGGSAIGNPQPDKKEANAFDKIHRELTDDELKNPIVQKWLISEVDKLHSCENKLSALQKDYHKLDKENAVLKTKSEGSLISEILSCTMFAIGPAMLGLTPSLLQNGKMWYMSWIILVLGIVLLLGAIIAKTLNLKK